MFSKKFLTSVCVVVSLCFCVMPKANAGDLPHLMIEKAVESTENQLLMQQVASNALQAAQYATLVKSFLSQGDLGAFNVPGYLDLALGSIADAKGGIIGGLSGGLSNVGSALGGAESMLGEGWDAVGQAGGALSAAGSGLSEASGALSAAGSAVNTTKNLINGEVNASDIMTTTGSAVGVAGAALGDEWAAVGQAGNALATAGKVYGTVEDKVKDGKKTVQDVVSKIKSIGNISIAPELQEIGFDENTMKDSKKMTGLIVDKLLPPSEEEEAVMTDQERAEREKRRTALAKTMAADAYALATSMEYEMSDSQEELIQSAKNDLESADTIQAKVGAGNNVAIANLGLDARRISLEAKALGLRAVNMMNNMGR
ncbi:MAG: hypothetical protein J6Y03_01100 [Alphaproteobacteria bacterium]|nr:hypothetical protein [Alphaproteobacteria bacterium]